MKKQFTPFLLVAVAALAFSFTACKSKANDADIKTAVDVALAANPMTTGMTVAVEKGVVTLTGECKDELTKTACEKTAAGVKDVKSVVNNCTVAAPPPPPPVANTDAAMLEQGLMDALKDQAGLKGSVVDGKIVLTGEIAKAKWIVVKQMLDKLKSAGYDLTGLKIK